MLGNRHASPRPKPIASNASGSQNLCLTGTVYRFRSTQDGSQPRSGGILNANATGDNMNIILRKWFFTACLILCPILVLAQSSPPNPDAQNLDACKAGRIRCRSYRGPGRCRPIPPGCAAGATERATSGRRQNRHAYPPVGSVEFRSPDSRQRPRTDHKHVRCIV